jgi:hypothetical protein
MIVARGLPAICLEANLKSILLIAASGLLLCAFADGQKPAKGRESTHVEFIALPFRFGDWHDLEASSGHRNYVVTIEVTNDAPVQVYGEVSYTDSDGKSATKTFSDGVPAKFATGNVIARIRVRAKTGGPTGAAVRVTQE